jgi:hypothetical protein
VWALIVLRHGSPDPVALRHKPPGIQAKLEATEQLAERPGLSLTRLALTFLISPAIIVPRTMGAPSCSSYGPHPAVHQGKCHANSAKMTRKKPATGRGCQPQACAFGG